MHPMDSPAELRERKIRAAEQARSLIDGLGKSHDLNARATMLHDRVSEGIKTICSQDQSFTQNQTEVLTEIAVHLALLFDADMRSPSGFWPKLKHEVSAMGPVGKLTFLGAVVALSIGLAQIAAWGWSLLPDGDRASKQEVAPPGSGGKLPIQDSKEPGGLSLPPDLVPKGG
ncbi:hypothetical protein ACQKGC_24805 [Allorhizobium pseudoryzae]|uniref:hypothetical protein n=1 Tax=Allorhizobium pseudoryzae TaxID=379684 RepID=UPI003CFD51E2